MSLPYELLVGLQYLRAGRRRFCLSLNTAISAGGVTVGVAALIATLAVMTGFSEELRTKILSTNAHITLTDRTGGDIPAYLTLIEKIMDKPNVVAAAPFILRQVLLSSGTANVGVVLRGIDTRKEPQISTILENLVAGRLNDLNSERTSSDRVGANVPGIIIGRELALQLGKSVGGEILLLSPTGNPLFSDVSSTFTPKVRKFQIVGIFSAGMLEYDTALAYVSLEEAQRFFNLSDVASGIHIKVDDFFSAHTVTAAINADIPFPYQARDWRTLNQNLFSALQMEKMMMFTILVLIILVASFNIVGTLTMTVVEKSREIAILKAMGATQGAIMRIFMVSGTVIAVMGLAGGIPLGVIICVLLGRYYTLPSDVYYLDHLPVQLQWFDVTLISLSALLIGFLATLYPAWRAGKMAPVEALRYE